MFDFLKDAVTGPYQVIGNAAVAAYNLIPSWGSNATNATISNVSDVLNNITNTTETDESAEAGMSNAAMAIGATVLLTAGSMALCMYRRRSGAVAPVEVKEEAKNADVAQFEANLDKNAEIKASFEGMTEKQQKVLKDFIAGDTDAYGKKEALQQTSDDCKTVFADKSGAIDTKLANDFLAKIKAAYPAQKQSLKA